MKLLILTFAFLETAASVQLLPKQRTKKTFSLKDTCAKRDLCYRGTNIACQEDRIKLCPGGKMIKFTTGEKLDIVNEHNKLRHDLATGKVSGFKPAARMGAMTWDAELAQMVDINIRKCVYEHDICHNTENYPMSGQNIAYIKGYNHGTFNRAAVVKEFHTMINKWFLEYKDADMNIIRNFKSNGKLITHFTGMSIDKNVRVGCAGVWYPEDDTGRVNFGCNYAYLTLLDKPVYIEGPAASKCKSGRDKKFPGLCSSNEKY